MSNNEEWNYNNKLILAPMVRMNTLPFRLLAYEYGADICYSEEIIAYKLIKCQRIINNKLNTIDYMLNNQKYPVFSMVPNEKVVLQMGVPESGLALKTAQLVEQDVRAIDINMGCPKKFSICGGMGAALLKKPDIVDDIIRVLCRNLKIPVTCKIRLLETREKTLQLCQIIERAGASAIAIHGRNKDDRPYHRALTDDFPHFVDNVNIPIIYNGDIFHYNDINKYKLKTKASSIMIARGAQSNVSIFRSNMLPLGKVIQRYYELAKKYNKLNWTNTKWCMGTMLASKISKTNTFRDFGQCKSWQSFDEFLPRLLEESELINEYKPHQITWKERVTTKKRKFDKIK